MTEQKQSEKETKKVISDDVEKFFRDVWGKVVEYASLGAEEATKVSATAKTRVDIETLKFKRGKTLKMLGERYWELVEKDSTLTVTGTGEIIRQIKSIEREINKLEKEAAHKAKKAEKKQAGETASTRKKAAAGGTTRRSAGSKTSSKKKPAAKKTAAKKTAAKKTAANKTAAKKPAPPKTDTATGVGAEE